MINVNDKNNVSITQSFVFLTGIASGIIAFYPIAIMLVLWFVVTLFISESLDEDILSVLQDNNPFMVGAKFGFYFSLIVFAVFNPIVSLPILMIAGVLQLFMDRLYTTH